MRITDTAWSWLVPPLLRLYPRAWRERYGNELAALLEDCQPSVRNLFDLLRGAMDAHVHVEIVTGRRLPMRDRLRRAEIAIFCAWIAFVIAGLAFQRVSEYDDFLDAARTYPLIGISYLALEIGAAVALLGVLAGGIPLALSALKHALAAQRSDVLLLFGVPVLAFMGLVLYGYIGIQVVPGASSANQAATTEGKALFLGLIGVLVLGASASSWALSAAISRSEIDLHWFRFARIPALVTALAMTVMCVATIAWGLALNADIPDLFNGEQGLIATSTAFSWLAVTAVMTIATLVAITAMVRGLLPGRRMHTATSSSLPL